MVSKQVKNTVAVLPFFDQQKGSVTSNKNELATYTAQTKSKINRRVINFSSMLFKKGQSNLVLVHVLVLESYGPY